MPSMRELDSVSVKTNIGEEKNTLNDSDADINKKVYQEYRTARLPRYKDMVDNDNFYHGVHYDENERNEIIAKGQAPLNINVTYAIVKQIIALLTSESPTWRVTPLGDTDKQYAYLMSQILDGTWYTSRGNRKYTQIVKDASVVGVGYGMANPTFNKAFGVEIKHLPYHQVYPSQNVREFDFSDAENIILSVILSWKQASQLLGISEEQIEKVTEGDVTFAEEERNLRYVRYITPTSTQKRCRVIQRLTLENETVYVIKPKGGTTQSQKIYFQKDEFLEKLIAKGAIEVKEETRKILVKYISVGSHCQKIKVPIDTYNIVPFIDEFTGNPWCLGTVDFLYGLQRALNKYVLLSLLNATLSNNMKVMAPKGVVNKQEFEDNYSTPGYLLEYDWIEGMPPPKEINPSPMSSEFFAMPKQIISIMEYITGIYGIMQGNPEGAPRTSSGLQSLQNYGGQKVKLLARNMDDALAALGNVTINLYQNYAPYNQTLTYFDERLKEETQVKYNQVKVKDGNIEIENDLSVGSFHTRVTTQQNFGSERQDKANALMNLASQTKSPALIRPILKLVDIPEADAIADSLDAVQQGQQQIEQLQQQLDRVNQVNTQLQNQILQKSQQMSMTEFDANLKVLYNKIKAEFGAEMGKHFNDLETKIAQFQGAMQSTQTPTS